MFSDTQNVKYDVKTSTVIFQGKPITLTERTPILSPEERARRKKDIESKLFNIWGDFVSAFGFLWPVTPCILHISGSAGTAARTK